MRNHEGNGGGGGRGRVVVITGASAGVGRDGPRVRPPGGEHRPAGAGTRRARGGPTRGGGLGGERWCPTDVADPRPGRGGRRGRQPGIRAGRRLGEQRHALGVLAGQADEAGGIPAGHRGDLPGICLRHAGRAAADAAARSGDHHPGRLGAGLPRHPAPVGVLRREARDPGILRLAPRRADPRWQPGPAHDGADAARSTRRSSAG